MEDSMHPISATATRSVARRASSIGALFVLILTAFSVQGCDQIEPQLPDYQKGYQPVQPIKY